MNPFREIFRYEGRKAEDPPPVSVGPESARTFRDLLLGPQASFSNVLDIIRETAFNCIEARARLHMKVDYGEFEKGEGKKLTRVSDDTEFSRWFADPNPDFSLKQLQRIHQRWQCAKGATYFLKSYKGKRLSSIWPLRADRVQPVWGKKNEAAIKQYDYLDDVTRTTEHFSVEQIIAIVNPSIENPYMPLSLMERGRASIEVQTDMRTAIRTYFKQGGLVSLFIEHEKGQRIDDLQAAWQEFLRMWTGVRRTGLPVFLDAGQKANVQSQNMDQVLLTGMYQMLKQDIHELFGVPPAMVGTAQESTLSSGTATKALQRVFIENTMASEFDLLADAFTKAFRYDFAEPPIVSYDDITPIDQREVADIAKVYTEMRVMTPNQILEYIGTTDRSDDPRADTMMMFLKEDTPLPAAPVEGAPAEESLKASLRHLGISLPTNGHKIHTRI